MNIPLQHIRWSLLLWQNRKNPGTFSTHRAISYVRISGKLCRTEPGCSGHNISDKVRCCGKTGNRNWQNRNRQNQNRNGLKVAFKNCANLPQILNFNKTIQNTTHPPTIEGWTRGALRFFCPPGHPWGGSESQGQTRPRAPLGGRGGLGSGTTPGTPGERWVPGSGSTPGCNGRPSIWASVW